MRIGDINGHQIINFVFIIVKKVFTMERYTELLYWLQFKQYIHYDEKTDTYYYDKELPERAKISFEKWLEQL